MYIYIYLDYCLDNALKTVIQTDYAMRNIEYTYILVRLNHSHDLNQ